MFEPVARKVSFHLDLKHGVEVRIPIELVPELDGASEEQLLGHLGLSPSGEAVTHRPLDVDIAVDGLLLDALGAAGWKRSLRAGLARELARSRSPRKAAASRENGRKGGRPRKSGPSL